MERSDILAALSGAGEQGLSGAALSKQLGVSRTAVWKGIEVLRREGYEIEAAPGAGYRLLSAPDALTEQEIRRHMAAPAVIGRELVCLESVDSTNVYAARLAGEGAPDGTAAIANQQTAGRGRMTRRFESPAGKGIYLSTVLKPELPPERLMPLTAMAGVALADAVEAVTGIRPGMKWPNDPILKSKKLCGILTELSMEAETGQIRHIILGIGVNVHQTAADFGPELSEMAISLSEAAGRFVSRPTLAAALLKALDDMYRSLKSGATAPYLAAFRRDCVNLGREVQLLAPGKPPERATALDIDDAFGLVVRTAAGETKTVRSGEVSVRGLYGYID